MAKAGDGKALEALLGRSVAPWGYSHNSNSLTPLCDRVQFLRDQGGRGVVWECKECRRDSFSLSDLKPAEEDNLNQSHASGALTILVFAHYPGPGQAAIYYGAWWPEWWAMEQRLGYVRRRAIPLAGRWKRNAVGSISLLDSKRPSILHRLTVYQSKGCSPLLDLSLFLAPNVKGIQSL